MNDKRTLLWAAIEDYSGLWEAVWELRSVHPEMSTKSLEATARGILEELLREGNIDLYWCQEPYGDMTLVPESEAAGLLAADEAFADPAEDALSVRFSATPSGEALYRSMWEQR